MQLLKVKGFEITHFTSGLIHPRIVQHLGHSLVAHPLHSCSHILMQYRQLHHANGFAPALDPAAPHCQDL